MSFTMSKLFVPDNISKNVVRDSNDPNVVRRLRDGKVFDPLPSWFVSKVLFSETPSDGDESSENGLAASIPAKKSEDFLGSIKFSDCICLFPPRLEILNKSLYTPLLCHRI